MATTNQLYKNNADSTVNGTIAIGASFFNVAPGHGTRFPTPSAGQYFLATLFEKNVGGDEINFEIVKVTSVTGDTLTVVRDFEGIVVGNGGTSGGWAYPSAIGVNPSQITYVQLRFTAYGAGNSLAKDGNLEGLENAATARGNLGISAANTPNTPAGNIAATTVQAAINELDAEKQPLDANTVKKNVANTFSAVQKSTVTTQSSLTVDAATAMDVNLTPVAGGTLTFNNIAAGQKFEILFSNTTSFSIAKGSNIKCPSTLFTTISATGRYVLAGRCLDGTNIDLTVSGALL